MKHNRHPVDILTDTKCLTDVLMPPDPQHMGCIPYITCRYPLEHIDVQESMGHTDVWQVLDIWGHPNIWGVQT